MNFSPGDLVYARGREWVAQASPEPGVLELRALAGGPSQTIVLDPELELEPVRPATFELPADARPTVQANAALLIDALRMTLRRGAGPFRSAGMLAFEPRSYQLVPLIMALRLEVPRLLIADDVGIGKTIEAGLIVRELLDRGEFDAFTVLCPPNLVEQWQDELKNRFAIDAIAITASSASRIERTLPLSQSLFDAYPFTIVSLDYIKAEKRRDNFSKSAPPLVIVDEAHSCVGVHRGRQQRFDLLKKLSEPSSRALLLLTATPHSGDELAFARLLSLLDPAFEALDFQDQKFRDKLARHFVQRRRADLTDSQWGEGKAFPKHESAELAYHLSPSHLAFQQEALDYCLGKVEGALGNSEQLRMNSLATLSLQRCVGSSPAAAINALRSRLGLESERLEEQVFDEDGSGEEAADLEPGADIAGEGDLQKLLERVQQLGPQDDAKFSALVGALGPLIEQGANPVIFCRYIATADYLRDRLRQAFPALGDQIQSVTGMLAPQLRREIVSKMAQEENPRALGRILVATDCLSEGINLQRIFDTVFHYDLSWNPTRHQQREGRVDRFGQPQPLVRSIMMYSPDSAIDGAVLEVILRKAEDIRKATGVTVPLPDQRTTVARALMAAMMLGRQKSQTPLLDLQFDNSTLLMQAHWKNAGESEKKSRAVFAQRAIKEDEVISEWEKTRSVLGSPADALHFVEQALKRFGAPLDKRGRSLLAPLDALHDKSLRERLGACGLKGTVALAINEPAPAGSELLTRSHPLTAVLAQALLEACLDPQSLKDLGMGRVGAWECSAVEQVTLLLLLRLRFKLTVRSRKTSLLLAEEAAIAAVAKNKILALGHEARSLLQAGASADLASNARERFISEARAQLPSLMCGPIRQLVQERACQLAQDHESLRTAMGHHRAGAASRVSVEAVLPPDVIALFSLIPA